MAGNQHPTEAQSSAILSLDEGRQLRDRKEMNAGWTLKGVPNQTVDMARKAARLRGMRIGAWVAESLQKAASRDLGGEPVLETRDEAVLKKLENVAEAIKQEFRVVEDQNRSLEQELGVIRRGLLPRIVSGGRE